MPAFLTIAIPTYNRVPQLCTRLQELLPQLTSDMEILVVDNASDADVEAAVRAAFPASAERIRFHRNRANIGLAANICRCFEVADGEWVWTLGDDDPVESHALTHLHATLVALGVDARLAGVHFSTSIFTYPQVHIYQSPGEFWRSLQEPLVFSNALFLSSCVFRADHFRQELRLAHRQIYSAAPHIAVPLSLLKNGFRMAVAPPKVVDCNVPETGDCWNWIAVFVGIPILAEIPGSGATSASLSPALARYAPGLGINEAVKNIFFDQSQDSLFWYIYYSRLLPCLTGVLAFRTSLLRLLAASCHRLPWFKRLGCTLLQPLRLQLNEPLGNMDRL